MIVWLVDSQTPLCFLHIMFTHNNTREIQARYASRQASDHRNNQLVEEYPLCCSVLQDTVIINPCSILDQVCMKVM